MYSVDIKVWGVQVTIKGSGAVNFNGDVEYKLGAGNEPESFNSIEPHEIPDIPALALKNVTTRGKESHYLRQANDHSELETKEPGTRDIRSRPKSEFGQPIPGVEATFIGELGTEISATSDDEGLLLFSGVPENEAGKVAYNDEKAFFNLSLAADIYNALLRKRQRQMSRCLMCNIDYRPVKAAFETHYGQLDWPDQRTLQTSRCSGKTAAVITTLPMDGSIRQYGGF
ncbi:MAG: hypothetical protein P8X74_17060 [Reinekea sp.]